MRLLLQNQLSGYSLGNGTCWLVIGLAFRPARGFRPSFKSYLDQVEEPFTKLPRSIEYFQATCLRTCCMGAASLSEVLSRRLSLLPG